MRKIYERIKQWTVLNRSFRTPGWDSKVGQRLYKLLRPVAYLNSRLVILRTVSQVSVHFIFCNVHERKSIRKEGAKRKSIAMFVSALFAFFVMMFMCDFFLLFDIDRPVEVVVSRGWSLGQSRSMNTFHSFVKCNHCDSSWTGRLDWNPSSLKFDACHMCKICNGSTFLPRIITDWLGGLNQENGEIYTPHILVHFAM